MKDKVVKISIDNYRLSQKGYRMSRPCTNCTKTLAKICKRFNIKIEKLTYTIDETNVEVDTLENLLLTSRESKGTVYKRMNK